MKTILVVIGVLLLIAIGAYFFIPGMSERFGAENETQVTDEQVNEDDERADEGEEQTENDVDEPETVLGTSVEGNEITAYHYGDGDTELMFIGGIHGGYSWNTSLVAYELMDHLEANPGTIPENVRVTVVPVMNPDGLESVVGTTERFSADEVNATESARVAGRFNANDVDLNRNFDCDWQSESTWQSRTVSGGTAAFSEPETQAIRDYVNEHTPDAVVVWYSAAGGVFASNCHGGVLPETTAITNIYADASGYQAYESFDFYEITGDMVNWMASESIPAISVLLTNHEDVEWNMNRRGIEALFEYYAEEVADTSAEADTE